MKEISVYKGTDEYGNRTATVYLNDEGTYIVRVCAELSMGKHNIIYAEDTAENFVLGILNVN